MVGFLPDDLENYISAHSESGGDIEKELRKETLGLGPSSGMNVSYTHLTLPPSDQV